MKNKKLNINKHLGEYKILKGLYEAFSNSIKSLLKNLLDEHGFKYHTIVCREKNEQSLKDKLQTLQSFKSVKNIDDLAGCRIIFYLEDSIERIIQYLRDEFKVVDHKLKYSIDGYNAFHLIVKLKKDRLQLSEYKRFDGLKCEIQLTTVLFHAWSEMAHDIIYKPEKILLEFSKPSFKRIKSLFSDIMKKHIKEAQHDFDFIANQMEDLRRGKETFDTFLQSLTEAETNNEIYQVLDNLLKYIKKYGGRIPKKLNIIEIINNVLKKSKKLKKVSEKHLWGTSPGMDYPDVAIVCLDILEYFRFVHPKEVFEILSVLSIDIDNRIRKQALDVASGMAEYLLSLKEKKIYYYPHIVIINEIEK